MEPPIRLVDEVYRRLRDGILDGRLPAGSRLSVPEVARQLSVSRSPAREAMLRLSKEGLIEILPHRGAIVVNVAVRDLWDLYQLREVLESLASRLAADRRRQRDLERLEQIMRMHRAALARNDMDGHRRSDLEFHSTIREISRNSRLIAALEQYQGQIQIGIGKTSAVPGHARLALSDHERIFEAIVIGDAGAAELATKQHIARVRELLLADPDGPREER